MFENLPVILSLLAGFIVCVAMFVYQYEGVGWLLIVLGTLIGFYILGALIKRLFKVVLAEPVEEVAVIEEKEDEAENEEVSEEME